MTDTDKQNSNVVRVDFSKARPAPAKQTAPAKPATRAKNGKSELLAHSIVQAALTDYR